MPQTGWCRECGEWVWVDESGACPNGHGPDCVEQMHPPDDNPIPEPVSLERPFGVGQMPAELHRFNWGAFFLPQFWGLAYSSWPVMLVWLGVLVSQLLIATVFDTGSTLASTTAVISASVISEMLGGAARLWAGLNATALVWKREAFRLEMVPGMAPRFSVERFESRQRVWAIVGAVLIGVLAVASVPVTAVVWADYGLTLVGPAMSLVWLGAEILLGFWLNARMRAEQWPPLENVAD